MESGETGRAGANTPLDELIFLTSITCASDARQCRKGACARALQPSKTTFTQLARRVHSHSPASHSSARRSPGSQTNKSARSCRARAGAPCRMMSCKSKPVDACASISSQSTSELRAQSKPPRFTAQRAEQTGGTWKAVRLGGLGQTHRSKLRLTPRSCLLEPCRIAKSCRGRQGSPVRFMGQFA